MVGSTSLTWSTAASSPVREAVTTLAEYEKVRVFATRDPKVRLSWATSDFPGWFQSDPTTDVGESNARSGSSAFQLSCV